MLGQNIDCGDYICNYNTNEYTNKVNITNKLTGNTVNIQFNDWTIGILMRNTSSRFFLLHFFAWLVDELPEGLDESLGLNTLVLKELKGNIISDLNRMGCTSADIESIVLYLLNA